MSQPETLLNNLDFLYQTGFLLCKIHKAFLFSKDTGFLSKGGWVKKNLPQAKKKDESVSMKPLNNLSHLTASPPTKRRPFEANRSLRAILRMVVNEGLGPKG